VVSSSASSRPPTSTSISTSSPSTVSPSDDTGHDARPRHRRHRYGATLEIAQAIAAGLARRGLEAEARPVEELAGLEGYDAFVVGSAVYVGRWLEPARELVEAHGGTLRERPVWLFSSGPLGPPDALKPEGDPVDAAAMVEASGAIEHRVFAGRLDRSLLSFGEKAVVIAVRAPEGDFRDWDEIDGFAAGIADHLKRG
jgi:menaquinone-dependent protoporphyrinogen oxidase